MPTLTPAFSSAHPPHFPALYLYPLNDTFVPKHISLVGGQRVKIGRQTNAKTVPGERNGYFDSKVLSRQHAEVWEENSKIFIKDVKSSNGTFINSERLSPEGQESDPFELKTDDVVEFGIDIVGEDNKTIIHHKVAARVTCIFNVEDALAAQREAFNFQQQQSQRGPSAALNGAAQKRPMIQPQANGLMGGMGGSARQPNRNGLTIEHILQRLSGELQKSRETSAELNAVAGAMGEIENVMGGAQPQNLPPYPQSLPPVRSQQSQQRAQQQSQPSQSQTVESEVSSAALQSLQNQLLETQASLSSHVEKIRTLEVLLGDHENIKRDVNALRDLIEEQRDGHRQHRVEEEDDDDRRSVHTVVPHELESVPEEDETEVEESEEERSARREELGRPHTPEPSSLGMRDDDYEPERRMAPAQPPGIPDELTRRLTFLSDQLESALEMSRTLQAQHTAAQQTIETLQDKVTALEGLVTATQTQQVSEGARYAEEASTREKAQQESMVSMFTEFRKTIEGRWESYKTELQAEHERVGKRQEEWEGRVKNLEDGVSKASGKFELGMANLSTQITNMKTNGHIITGKHVSGLVTPPSPRSMSDADSDSDRPLKTGIKGRRRSRSKRGRLTKESRSRSPATSTSATLVDGMSAPGTESSVASLHSRRSSRDSPSDVRTAPTSLNLVMEKLNQYPTPEASIRVDDPNCSTDAKDLQQPQTNAGNVQLAVGVFVLGFATAAVLWRVKE